MYTAEITFIDEDGHLDSRTDPTRYATLAAAKAAARAMHLPYWAYNRECFVQGRNGHTWALRDARGWLKIC